MRLGIAGWSVLGLLLAGGALVAAENPRVLAEIDRLERRAGARVDALCREAGLAGRPTELFLRVLKQEGRLECWGRGSESQSSDPLRLLRSYVAHNLPRADLDDPYAVENVGPKQRVGDLRVPEGVYPLLYHNPWSSYHLSLAVGYPNLADAIRGELAGTIEARGRRQLERWWAAHGAALQNDLLAGPSGLWDGAAVQPLGNQIFIHGKEVTIGCVPIGDAGIEELFLLTDPRRVGGTVLHVFPCRMEDPGRAERLLEIARARPELGRFWDSLRPVYRHFEAHRRVPDVKVDAVTGLYQLQP